MQHKALPQRGSGEGAEFYMQRCLQLARCGEAGAAPNPMVGAVVVCDGRIIGEGFHRRCGGPHAEVNAIGSVKERHLLSRSTIYVSLEPCAHYGKTPPCADLIIQSGIRRVIIGCTDPFAKVNGLGIRKLQEAGCEVTVGVLEEECRELNRRFFTFHEKHRPWITLKWAQSEDKYISPLPAPPWGECPSCKPVRFQSTPPKGERGGGCRGSEEGAIFFSNALTQTLVHRLRARNQAILVGTRTALADNPTLTTRLWDGPNPLRLTIDRHNILPPTLHLKDGSTPTVIYTHETLQEILEDLYNRGIQTLLVEGGSQLLQSFIDAGLWDEARIETAPFCLGDGVKAPVLAAGELASKVCYFGNEVKTIKNLYKKL
ncbi:MAG: bifunctional diaminohydroxyphosphoribosylaminopyrimidine deaminase/5-amino-6-(5-phosphoribosylamino)uracil reductase RibD [Bacteroidaceae bacterium]|nr:bifunctional diaminohydroxyphosphoribosylaminopyrimidine deaminase/5-amino-6-(5-phosphoribosylamino)uracil reductase RibD [Bacteroidaceae bacterium]